MKYQTTPLKAILLGSIVLLIFPSIKLFAQDTSQFSISGYADAYYAYYTDSIGVGDYQKFPSVSPRSNQVGLNIAELSAKYFGKRVRGTITVQYGDIPKSAWSSTFNFVQEANIGIRLCKNLWLDGGFFRTHIGTEALFPRENYTSSVAVTTFFEPYYEAGFRLNYQPTDKLALFLFLLNGYNLYEDNNKKKSGGLLATYSVNDQINFGYDNYLGDDSPVEDSTAHLRFYNNVFLNLKFNKFKLTTGLDFSTQSHSQINDEQKTATMISGVLIPSFDLPDRCRVYGRVEFFNDANGFLSGVFFDDKNELTGLKIWGLTVGAEWKPTENSYIRLEGRDLAAASDQKIFYWNGKNTNVRFEAMINFGVSFP